MPDKRTEMYRKADGTLSPHRSDAILVTAAEVLSAVVYGSGALRLDVWRVPASYWTATARHESNFAINEVDTETSGFQSYGIFQISQSEAAAMRFADVDLLTLEGNAQVMVRLVCRARRALRAACDLVFDDQPDPPDMPAYLAIAHNLGLLGGLKPGEHTGAVVSVLQHGLDWRGPGGFKARNPGLRIVSSGYGDDCLNLAARAAPG